MEQQRFVRRNTALIDAQRRNERKRKRRTVFYVFLFLAISMVFLAVCAAAFLKVETISINGSEKYSYEQIREVVAIVEGENIYAFNSTEIENSILKAFPYINSVEVRRDLPTTVEINIVEEIPYFSAELAGDTYVMSADLKVLEKREVVDGGISDLTVLSLNNVRQCVVGNKLAFVNERTLNDVNLLYECFVENYIDDKITSVDVRSRFDMYVNYEDRFEIYIGDIEDIDIKIRFLVAIIEELEENATGTIDVSNPHEASVALS